MSQELLESDNKALVQQTITTKNGVDNKKIQKGRRVCNKIGKTGKSGEIGHKLVSQNKQIRKFEKSIIDFSIKTNSKKQGGLYKNY